MDRDIPLRVRRKESLKKIIKYLAFLCLSIVLVIILINFLKGSISSKNIIIAEVDRGTLEITVNASGKVVPLSEEIIVSPISSKILEVYKNPGDLLEAREPILKLDLTNIATEYRQKLDEQKIKKSKLAQKPISKTVFPN